MVVVFLVQSCDGSIDIGCTLEVKIVGFKSMILQVHWISNWTLTGLLHVVVGSMLKYVKYVEVC